MTVRNSRVNALVNASAETEPTRSLNYRRLRAPQNDGQVLQSPPLSSAAETWAENLALDLSGGQFETLGIESLRQSARQQCIELAVRYSARYLDIDLDGRNRDQILIAGHQPTLFHPGVWFKNFVLCRLARQFHCMPVNLIVDNDICGVTSLRIPRLENGRAFFETIAIDEGGDNVPFEARKIIDQDLFRSFSQRAAGIINPLVKNPIVRSLWQLTLDNMDPSRRLGHTVAAGRHALEHRLGLQTLELPISELAQTAGFARFLFELIERSKAFADCYNRTLHAYRRLHRIRSNSHPVPPLEVRGEWTELPFWIWHRQNPIRRSLFCSKNGGTIKLSDGSNIVATLAEQTFVEQICELQLKQLCIRPKALMTTMFSRLVLSDMFLHGIGGSKYDQMTDAIIEQFFNVRPAKFMTLSATMKLPIQFAAATPEQAVQTRVQMRELEFHPETLLEDPTSEQQKWIDKKLHWVQQQFPRGQRLERHLAIEECNRNLRSDLKDHQEQLEQKQKSLEQQVELGRVLGSREVSFCLHPESLANRLRNLAE